MSFAWVVCAAVHASASALAAQPAVEIGEPAPGFGIRDVDGHEHTLTALRGRVVVLEWTSHVCPAVAAYEDSGILCDTRARAAELGAAWLAIDSGWFAGAMGDDIRGWRVRRGHAHPYLLDTDGVVGRRYRATATPQVFIIDREGKLAYRGAVDNGSERPHEAQRRNYVLEALDAVLGDRAVPTARTRAIGCAVKYGAARRPAPEDIDDNPRAAALFRSAATLAQAGRFEPALNELGRSVEAGQDRLHDLLRDPEFRPLLADDGARARLRELLRAHPARARLRLTAPDEPGEALIIAGRVLDEEGSPVSGARIYVFHTDAGGWYSPGTTSARNPRLCGYVRTGGDGGYRIRTVEPGTYADASSMPRHLHFEISAQGFHSVGGVRGSVYFDDDPLLTQPHRDEARSDGSAIRGIVRNAEGTRLCVHDIVLSR